MAAHKHNKDCPCSNYLDYLVKAAPDILWYDVQDVGSYSGSVFGVGEYKKKILIYTDYYGSCSGCGGWGEGGEPRDMDMVLENSELFDSREKALESISQLQKDEMPDRDRMRKAINEVADSIRSIPEEKKQINSETAMELFKVFMDDLSKEYDTKKIMGFVVVEPVKDSKAQLVLASGGGENIDFKEFSYQLFKMIGKLANLNELEILRQSQIVDQKKDVKEKFDKGEETW